jgi:Mg-chelatase subunit ChlD
MNMLKKAKTFGKSAAGSTSSLFALAIVPVLLCVGAATDFVRMQNARTELAAALDGAALAAAQGVGMDPAQRIVIGEAYFAANFNSHVVENASANIQVVGNSIRASANMEMPTSLMHLMGISKMDLKATAEANLRSAGNAELVLVLDYSGSMNAQAKYSRMADAATTMLTSLESAAAAADFKVGLVPFSAMVRTSMSSEYVNQASATPVWTGCTQDRAYPFNTGVTTPTEDENSKWGYVDSNGENNGNYGCNAYYNKNLTIQPLTSDFDSVRSQLAGMRPLGNTNIALGAEFGWNLLDPALPFDEARPYADATNRKFLVLLTDGVQTSSEFGEGNGRSVPNAQSNLTALCAGMRNADITVFAIAYDVTDPAVTTLLQNCAPGRYFEPAVGGNDISAVFAEITNQITDDVVRLTK